MKPGPVLVDYRRGSLAGGYLAGTAPQEVETLAGRAVTMAMA